MAQSCKQKRNSKWLDDWVETAVAPFLTGENDPTVEVLRARGLPVTRQNHLWAAGWEEPLDPEQEQSLPLPLSRAKH